MTVEKSAFLPASLGTLTGDTLSVSLLQLCQGDLLAKLAGLSHGWHAVVLAYLKKNIHTMYGLYFPILKLPIIHFPQEPSQEPGSEFIYFSDATENTMQYTLKFMKAGAPQEISATYEFTHENGYKNFRNGGVWRVLCTLAKTHRKDLPEIPLITENLYKLNHVLCNVGYGVVHSVCFHPDNLARQLKGMPDLAQVFMSDLGLRNQLPPIQRLIPSPLLYALRKALRFPIQYPFATLYAVVAGGILGWLMAATAIGTTPLMAVLVGGLVGALVFVGLLQTLAFIEAWGVKTHTIVTVASIAADYQTKLHPPVTHRIIRFFNTVLPKPERNTLPTSICIPTHLSIVRDDLNYFPTMRAAPKV